MTCDPNWSDVQLLVTFDGTSGQNSFTDLSQNALTLTPSGPGATVSTVNPAFGTGSLNSGGTDWVNCPAGGPLNLGQYAQWTIEFWFRSTYGYANYLMGNDGFSIELVSDGIVQIYVLGAGTFSSSGRYSDGAWHAAALVSDGTNARLYVDGTLDGVSSTPPSSIAWVQALELGAYDGQVMFNNNTSIDEVRISSILRYSGNYSPAGPFPTGPCEATVPNVVGLLDPAAQTAIVAASFIVGTITTEFSTDPVGTVLAQSPAGGTTAAPGSAIDLTEAVGIMFAVPDLTNLSLAIVVPGLLAAAELVLGSVTPQTSGTIIAGNVISQSPAGGTEVSPGTPVNVVVSSGAPPLTVPDIFELSQTDASNAITTLGLTVGAISTSPSPFVPPGVVMFQNPTAGQPAVVGQIVSFVISTGPATQATEFDFESTVISQFYNSPTIQQLVSNMNAYVDRSANFEMFYNYIWNVDTAVGFGLDIWGKIVNVGRLLQISTDYDYVGFYQSSESQPDQDWQPMGSDQDTPPVGGAMYTGYNATTAYLLPDDAYRQLILAKAFANICATTAPSINQILQNLFGPGSAWVLNTGPMSISYNLSFVPSAIQLAILEQSGVIPTPPGVAFVVNTDV